MEIEQTTNNYEPKDVSKYLWIVMALILSGGYIAGEYEKAETETRKIYHLNEFRGHLINMMPVSINENCTE